MQAASEQVTQQPGHLVRQTKSYFDTQSLSQRDSESVT